MPSIKNLEMAAAVSTYRNITIKKSLFSTKAVYTPTHSPVRALVEEFTPSEGERLERLLDMPLDKMVAEIKQKGKPTAGANGNFRLEACLSDDSQFCAVQLSRFSDDFTYHPVFDVRFYEGVDAEMMTQIL